VGIFSFAGLLREALGVDFLASFFTLIALILAWHKMQKWILSWPLLGMAFMRLFAKLVKSFGDTTKLMSTGV
jgi:ABC-type long-subunit fatty acid transport system fused permease/ATPase subunit